MHLHQHTVTHHFQPQGKERAERKNNHAQHGHGSASLLFIFQHYQVTNAGSATNREGQYILRILGCQRFLQCITCFLHLNPALAPAESLTSLGHQPPLAPSETKHLILYSLRLLQCHVWRTPRNSVLVGHRGSKEISKGKWTRTEFLSAQSHAHRPMGLHLQNTNSKIKLLKIPRCQQPLIKPSARPFSAQGTVSLSWKPVREASWVLTLDLFWSHFQMVLADLGQTTSFK